MLCCGARVREYADAARNVQGAKVMQWWCLRIAAAVQAKASIAQDPQLETDLLDTSRRHL